MSGRVGWLRDNLFSSPFNIALTIVCVAADRLDRAADCCNFLIIDAVWTGADRDACLDCRAAPRVGACWPFVWERFAYFIYGFYPDPAALAGRRRFSCCSAFGIVWLLWLNAPRRDLGALYFFIVLPVVSFILLHGFAAIGLPVVDTALWGGVLVTIVVASVGIVFSLPLGILLALGRRSHMPVVRLLSVDLHRIRARRAADHRAVHGERDAAAVRARTAGRPTNCCARWSASRCSPRPIWRRWCAAGLQAIPRGPIRGRAWRSGLGYWQMMRLDRPAAGAEGDDPEHRQHLYRPVQGYDAGLHRRHLRFPAHHRGRAHRSEMGGAGHDPPPAMPSPRCSISSAATACRAMRARWSAARAAGHER